jgi:transposase-like protein
VKAFLDRPIEGDWPYVRVDATDLKVRQAGRIVSVAVTIAIGASEAETFWTDFLRSLARRGLRGVKLVIPDAHEGIKAAVSRVFSATWQRWRVHFARNAMAHAGKSGRRVVPAIIATAYAQETPEAAKGLWRKVADQLRPSVGRVRQRGVISGVPPGRIVQAAFGVICSGVTSSICGVARAAMPSICM